MAGNTAIKLRLRATEIGHVRVCRSLGGWYSIQHQWAGGGWAPSVIHYSSPLRAAERLERTYRGRLAKGEAARLREFIEINTPGVFTVARPKTEGENAS